MLKFYIQFLMLFLLLWTNKRVKGAWVTPSGVLIAIYAVSSLFAIFELIISDYWTEPFLDSYWVPMLEFDLFIIIFLLPFRQFNESRVHCLKLPSRDVLDVFSTIIIVLSFFAIIYYMGTVTMILTSGNMGYLRDERYVTGEEYVESGLLNTIASVSSANYVFAIVLFFIYHIIGGSKKRQILLLISSVSNAVHVLAFVGRDGIVFWLFTFAFCYAFFRPYMEEESKRKVLRLVRNMGIVLVVPFMMITFSRFDSYSTGTSGSIISYLGQSFIYGPLFFGIENKPLCGIDSAFPLIAGFWGSSPGSSSDSFGGPLVIGDWMTGHFSTFVVNLYRSLHLGGLILFIFLYYTFFIGTIYRAKGKLLFGSLVYYLLYFQVVSEGVFYFCHAQRGGNLFIITTLILGFVFNSITKSNSKSIILNRQS